MSHLSVIVTDGSHIALQVQEVVSNWARAGLLGESVWVCPGDVTPTAGPAQVLSTVIGPDGAERADLFHTIGVRRLDTVRLVIAQFVVSGDDRGRELPELGTALAELLSDALPRPTSGDSEQGTALRRTNVIIPASGITGLCQDALLPGWDANAVVAAEDRPDLDRASVYVREGGNYTGHAAAAIASVGALWSGIGQGCLDVLDTDSTTTDTDVAVVRHAVRAVVRSNDAQRLADAACAHIVSNPSVCSEFAEWARPALQPDDIIDSVLAETMQTGDWKARDHVPEPDPEKGQRPFGVALHEAAAYNLRLFRVGFAAIVEMGRRGVEKIGTGALVGHKGDFVVRFQPSTSGSAVLRAQQEQSELQTEDLRKKMLIDEAGSVEAPNAATWLLLRRTSFGLIDGSQLPGDYQVSEIAGKPQLLPPPSVVPDPTDTFQTMDGRVIGACDAKDAAEYLLELKEAAGEPRPTTDGGSSSAVPMADGNIPGGLAGADTDIAQDEDLTAEEVSQQKARRKRAREELAALDAWLVRRSHTLVWRVYEGVEARAAENSLEAQRSSRDATTANLPPTEALRGSQRALIVGWSILGLVFAAISLFFWFGLYPREVISADELLARTAGLILSILILGVLINHFYYRAVRRFERLVEKTLALRRRAADQYVVAQREARRFQLLASRLNDWAQIIGSVLYRPWEPQPAGGPSAVAEGSLTHLPAAVAIAVPPLQTSDISEVVMARAIQVLTPKGWASQLFEEAVDAYESNVRSARDGGYLAADLDTLNSPTSPLGLLQDFFFGGEAATHAAASARECIEQALADRVLELPPRSVRRMGEYADGKTVSEGQFFGGVLHPSILFVGGFWRPSGLMNHKNAPDESVAWMPRGAGVSQAASLVRFQATGDVAMRVDISRRCDFSDLAVFVPEEATERDEPDPDKAGDF